MQTPGRDVAYITPIYGQSEAAQIIQAPPTSFARWAHGHRFPQRTDGEFGWSPPLLTGVGEGRGLTVPFNALAEGFIIESFRRVGLPMARIRPAIEVLQERIAGAKGVDHVTIRGAGHFLQEDKGEAVARATIDFIRANPVG